MEHTTSPQTNGDTSLPMANGVKENGHSDRLQNDERDKEDGRDTEERHRDEDDGDHRDKDRDHKHRHHSSHHSSSRHSHRSHRHHSDDKDDDRDRDRDRDDDEDKDHRRERSRSRERDRDRERSRRRDRSRSRDRSRERERSRDRRSPERSRESRRSREREYSRPEKSPDRRDDYSNTYNTNGKSTSSRYEPEETEPMIGPMPVVKNPKIDFDKYDEIPVETSGRDCPRAIEKWSDADLGSMLLRNIEEVGYKKPTPVQRYAIPIALKTRDIMACAQTGSGKTAAFLFPIIAKLQQRGPRNSYQYGRASPAALVLAPTRELACQIVEEGRKFSSRTGIKCVVVYGGQSMGVQLRELERGCDILVATPGRLSDIMERKRVSLASCRYLVLDEADRMLDMGFEPQIRRIVEKEDMPRTGDRQTLMFSATFPKEIQRLASEFLHDYIFLTVGRVGSTTDLVTQRFIKCDPWDKKRMLAELLRQERGLCLIFTETKKDAASLGWELQRMGFRATSIHGDRSQQERTAALRSFSTGETPFLIATNVAARGLDIDGVAHVINYDMPNNIEDYVHRIGRTGRAGHHGVSTAFITTGDAGLAGKLVDVLEDANQEVPPWLLEMRGANIRSKPKQRGGGRFGGKDFRLKDANMRQQWNSGPPPPSHAGFGGGHNIPPPAQSFGGYPQPPPPSGGGGSQANSANPQQAYANAYYAAAYGGAAPPGFNPYQYYPQYPMYGAWGPAPGMQMGMPTAGVADDRKRKAEDGGPDSKRTRV